MPIVCRLILALSVMGCAFLEPWSAAFAVNRVSYKGLTPGISTEDDTLRLLGRPVSRVFAGDRLVCKYRFVQVNIPNKTGRVQFILIYDPDFTDVNGFKLGNRYSAIKEKLKIESVGNTIVDEKNGIAYIFTSEGLVDQIVYGIVR
jgi:hypothetical protein